HPLKTTEKSRKPAFVPGVIHVGSSQGNEGRERRDGLRTPLCWFLQHVTDTRWEMALIVPKIRSSSARVPREDREQEREKGPAGLARLRVSVRSDVRKSRGRGKGVENFGSGIRDMALRVAGI